MPGAWAGLCLPPTQSSSSISEPSPINCSQTLLVPSFLSVHYFPQHTLVWWVKHSPNISSAVNTRDRIERVKGCRGDIGDRAAILTSCHGKIITQTHSAHEQTQKDIAKELTWFQQRQNLPQGKSASWTCCNSLSPLGRKLVALVDVMHLNCQKATDNVLHQRLIQKINCNRLYDFKACCKMRNKW